MFRVSYGDGIACKRLESLCGRLLVVTQENLLKKYSCLLPQNAKTALIESVEEIELERLARENTDFDAIAGLGGGMAADAAKYAAWRNGIPCYLFPTAISVDACFSYPIAVRREKKVVYLGSCIAEEIIVDFGIVKSAPKELNLCGVGDVLSAYTGLFDWKVMERAGKCARISSYLYNGAQRMLDGLFNRAEDIAGLTDEALKYIIESYRWVGEQSYKHGFCYFEEGCEHYFAYALESLTGCHLAHGRLVCLGVYIMSKFQQEGRQHAVLDFLNKIGLSISPRAVGVTSEEISGALQILNEYVLREKLAYSIVNEKRITQDFINEVLEELRRV